ncbi:ABC transporter permease subunit [Cellulomonas cellasea]|uniref:Maltose/maltodextrin transport system permease protein n=2 Tax=Cellulomonas cellasea TaxID=43670 RepID=A0A0A0B3T7_9CELL|nr:ABC transporter permease subunit [Cellulomonas cellasea]KGM00848.1 maltose ABC transporter permease [Cellulomonas cellasea DSM 20118]GEA89244.1 sugar ABC transporter permease [Cellulomonas cellasea]
MSTQQTEPAKAGPEPRTPAPEPRRRSVTSHARDVKPGFVVKLVLVALVDALGLYGILAAAAVQSWGIVVFLVLALVAVNWVYFSRRMLPGKYLVPGLLFLLVYQLFVMAYTGYVSFTNYGDGHNSTKADAIQAIQVQTERRVEGSPTYPVTVLARGDELALGIVDEDGHVRVGTSAEPLETLDGAQADGDRITGADGFEVLGLAQIAQRQGEITELRVPVSDDASEGSLRTQDGSTGYVYTPSVAYDEAADTFTDLESGTVYTPSRYGTFTAEDGSRLTPGWRVGVGLENYTAMFSDSRLSGPFFTILAWTFAFAILSVVTTFGLGLFLAIVFNDPRVRGRRFYRSLLILPYAFPGFLAALVWRGMLNPRFGFVNEVLLGGADVPWLTDPWLAKLSILLVNLWLGFPYMFLVCTGALQAIPSDVIESARMDGAGAFRVFRSMTLPLLMISVAPLLISSFAFNFNNFTLIYMLTGGGPNFESSPVLVGHTDILISMVYAVAFESGVKQYGLASAVSILIFVIVGAISYAAFRRTKTLEEL